jgi:Ca2+-binding EF-hand superfamily protein
MMAGNAIDRDDTRRQIESLEAQVDKLMQKRSSMAYAVGASSWLKRMSTTVRKDELVDIDELDVPEWLRCLLRAFDETQTGFLSKEDTTRALELMARRREQVIKNAPEFNYSDMPESVQDVLKTWDHNGSGSVNADDLMEAALAQQQLSGENRWAKRFLALGFVMITILIVVNFVAFTMAVDAAKDFRPNKNGTLQSSVSTKAGVEADRRLLEAEELEEFNPVGTRAATVQGGIRSTMSDEDLRELQAVTVSTGNTGDGGFVELQVVSRVREETITSKCGSVLHLVTTLGRMTFDDMDAFLSEELYKNIAAAAGENAARRLLHDSSNARSVGRGRRLGVATSLHGFFNILKGTRFECKSVEKPVIPFANYQWRGRQEISCGDMGCTSKLADTLKLKWKPGVKADFAAGQAEPERKILIETFAFHVDGEILQVSQYPNHPLQQYIEIDNAEYALKVQSILGTNEFSSCQKVKRDPEIRNSLTDLERRLQAGESHSGDFQIQYLGKGIDYSANVTGIAIRKFRIKAKSAAFAREKRIVPIQFWDRDEPGNRIPYKYFTEGDGVSTMMSSVTFQEFEDLDLDFYQNLRKTIPDDLATQLGDPRCGYRGKNATFLAKVPHISEAASENMGDLMWYYDMFYAMRQSSASPTEGIQTTPGMTQEQAFADYGPYWGTIFGADEAEDKWSTAFGLALQSMGNYDNTQTSNTVPRTRKVGRAFNDKFLHDAFLRGDFDRRRLAESDAGIELVTPQHRDGGEDVIWENYHLKAMENIFRCCCLICKPACQLNITPTEGSFIHFNI